MSEVVVKDAEKNEETVVLYVYGTLRPGNKENTLRIPGRMFDLGWFPGVVLLPDDFGVTFLAERVEIPKSRLKDIDRYEGYLPGNREDSLYVREPFRDGFIYVYNRSLEGCPEVSEGDWLKHTQESSGVSARKVA